jgi:hypothetical protein
MSRRFDAISGILEYNIDLDRCITPLDLSGVAFAFVKQNAVSKDPMNRLPLRAL